MQTPECHTRWLLIFRKVSLLFVLLIYLIIPFKKHFLRTVHFVSHVAFFENPNHSHDHVHHGYAHFHETEQEYKPEHEHHHNQLDVLKRIFNQSEEEEALPNELVTFRFQVEVPSETLQVSDQFPIQFDNTFKPLLVLFSSGPSFDVPIPPP